MPSAGDIRAGGAFVELTAKDEGLRSKLEQAEHRLRHLSRTFHHFGEGLVLAGGAILGPVGLAMHLLQKAKDLDSPAGEAARQIAEQWERVEGVMLHVAGRLGEALLPTIEKFADALSDAGMWLGRVIDQNRELVVLIVKVAGAALAIGTGFIIAAKAVHFLMGAIGLLSAAISVMNAIAWANPYVLLGAIIIAAVAAIGVALAALWTQTKRGSEAAEGLKRDWTIAWEGIVATVKGGQLELAFEITWTAIKLSFARMLRAMRQQFEDFASSLGLPPGFGAGLFGGLAGPGALLASQDAVVAGLEKKLKELRDQAKATQPEALIAGGLGKSVGTFSSRALYESFGVGDNALGKRIAEATEQTKEEVVKANDQLGRLGQMAADVLAVGAGVGIKWKP